MFWIVLNIILQSVASVFLACTSQDYLRTAVKIAGISRLGGAPRLLAVAALEDLTFHYILVAILPPLASSLSFAALHSLSLVHFLQALTFSLIQIKAVSSTLAGAIAGHFFLNLVLQSFFQSPTCIRFCRRRRLELLALYKW